MKVRNKDIERPAAHAQLRRHRGSSLNSFLAGAATVLLLLAGAGGYLLYRAMEVGDVKNPFSPNQTDASNTSSVEPPNSSPAAPAPASIAPGQFVEPSLGNRAQVELLSVQRIAQNPDEVKVQMRIDVLEDMDGGEMLDVSQTSARNPVTDDIYPPAEPETRSSGLISLMNMSKGQSVDASVVLKVPIEVSNIDISVHETSTFRNVPVALAGSGRNAQNSSSVNPSGGTPAPAAGVESQPGPVVR